ncbi:MAG: SpoIIE family protein phosphatase [Pirellulales bacterium]|nr:SpoIIE family protein phosphatase [Pirellulales bacterium]
MTRVASPALQLALLEPPPQVPAFAELPGLGELCRTFSQVTGWSLRYVAELKPTVELLWSAEVCPGVDPASGYLRIDLDHAASLDDLRKRMPLESAEKLAECLLRQLRREWELRTALWEREAELATAIPVVARSPDSAQLATRLQSLLQSLARALGCRAAAFYLLDDATTELRLRSAWGLPPERCVQPARPLAGALADLEALLGHAVVIDSPGIHTRWNVPEECAAAVCVPISSPTVPLGTLWVFADNARDFSDEQTNLCEIIAGRIAAELERSALLQDHASIQAERAVWQHSASDALPAGPETSPMVPGWDIAGHSEQAGPIGGAFHDWLLLPDGRLAVWLGDACEGGLAGAMTAASLRGMLRYELEQGCPRENIEQILARCHHTLLGLSAGNHWAGALLVFVDPRTGECEITWSGRPLATKLSPPDSTLIDRQLLTNAESRGKSAELAPPQNLLQPLTPLGIGQELITGRQRQLILPGEMLLGFNRGLADVTRNNGQPLQLAELLRNVAPTVDSRRTAQQTLERIQGNLRSGEYNIARHDLSLIVIRREK